MAACISDAEQTPRGKSKGDGSLDEITSLPMRANVLTAIAARDGVEDIVAVGKVIWGGVTTTPEQGSNVARGAGLAGGWDAPVLGFQVNRFCARR